MARPAASWRELARPSPPPAGSRRAGSGRTGRRACRTRSCGSSRRVGEDARVDEDADGHRHVALGDQVVEDGRDDSSLVHAHAVLEDHDARRARGRRTAPGRRSTSRASCRRRPCSASAAGGAACPFGHVRPLAAVGMGPEELELPAAAQCPVDLVGPAHGGPIRERCGGRVDVRLARAAATAAGRPARPERRPPAGWPPPPRSPSRRPPRRRSPPCRPSSPRRRSGRAGG